MSTKKLQIFGLKGSNGVGISSIEQTKTSTESGGQNELTITMTDGNKYTAVVQNGERGEQGFSGVYVGSGDMPEGYNVQIDPDSEPDDLVTKEEFSKLSDTIANLKGLEPTDDDIPKVFFGAPLPQTKDDTIMSFRYISNTKDISGYCKTKAQGNSSMSFPKKNQTVKLYKDAECTEKLKVDFKGWGKQNKFCFKANWIDLTHARNIVSARLWGDVVKTRSNYSTLPDELRTSPNQGAVDGFFVKVYAGGVYQGRYTLNIPKDAWMANMDDSLDEHCILCSENYFSGCFRAEAKIDESDWSDEIHDTVPESIKTRWNEVISFVMNSTDEEFINGIDNYIDLESLIDYYCVGVAICHNDGFGKNQLFVTYDGQKWYASYYDLDNTFGAYLGYMLPYNFSRYSYEDFNASYQAREGNLLHIRVEKLFAERIKARYSDLRKNALSVENTINRFERFLDVCPPHLIEEDYATTTANGQFTEIPLQDENNIQQIRDFIVKRYEYVDGFINTLGVDTRLLYSLYDQAFDGTKEQLIKTDVQLFDSPKSFTVFVDATTGEEQPKNVCLVDCAWNSSGQYCGGFQAKTYAYADKNGFMCTGAKSNGGASIFKDFTSEERTRMVITYRNGLPELQRYRKESDITITTNSPFSKWVEETTHDGTVCIGGINVGRELFIGTIHALEIYEGVLSDEEINAWLNEGKSEDQLETYVLPQETVFDGVSTYIDTKVKLFDTPKDFTIVIDVTDGENNTSPSKVFSCRKDADNDNGVYIGGLAIRHATSKNLMVTSSPIDESLNGDSWWFSNIIPCDSRLKIAITFLGGIAATCAYKTINSDAITTQTAISGKSYRQHDNTIILGASNVGSADTVGEFWNGTIHSFEVYNYAMSTDEISKKFTE